MSLESLAVHSLLFSALRPPPSPPSSFPCPLRGDSPLPAAAGGATTTTKRKRRLESGGSPRRGPELVPPPGEGARAPPPTLPEGPSPRPPSSMCGQGARRGPGPQPATAQQPLPFGWVGWRAAQARAAGARTQRLSLSRACTRFTLRGEGV